MKFRMWFTRNLILLASIIILIYCLPACFSPLDMEQYLQEKAGKGIEADLSISKSETLDPHEKLKVSWPGVEGASKYRLRVDFFKSHAYSSSSYSDEPIESRILTVGQTSHAFWGSSFFRPENSRVSTFRLEISIAFYSETEKSWSAFGEASVLSFSNSTYNDFTYFPDGTTPVSLDSSTARRFITPGTFSSYSYIRVQVSDQEDFSNIVFDSDVVVKSQGINMPVLRPDRSYYWRSAYLHSADDEVYWDYNSKFRFGFPFFGKRGAVQLAGDHLFFTGKSSSSDISTVNHNSFNVVNGEYSTLTLSSSANKVTRVAGQSYYLQSNKLYQHIPGSADQEVTTPVLNSGGELRSLLELGGKMLVGENSRLEGNQVLKKLSLLDPQQGFQLISTFDINGTYLDSLSYDRSTGIVYFSTSDYYNAGYSYLFRYSSFNYNSESGVFSPLQYYNTHSTGTGKNRQLFAAGSYLICGMSVIEKINLQPLVSGFALSSASGFSDGNIYVEIKGENENLLFEYYDGAALMAPVGVESIPFQLPPNGYNSSPHADIYGAVVGNEYVLLVISSGYAQLLRHPRPDFCINQSR